MTNNLIRTKPEPLCKCCQSEGTYLYRNLKDRLFGVQGEWHLKKCNNINCGLIWQDPMPIEEDLGLAYQSYYTHQDNNASIKRNCVKTFLRNIYLNAKQGYLATKYGYAEKQTSLKNKLLGYFLYLYPGRRANIDFEVFYLPVQNNGRLLEVGFGSGEMLQGMQQKGWIAEGIDFDPNAVSNALSKGLNVRLGSLAEQHYADNTFDAIVMSHVLEHVHDPLQLLKECHRVLKRGGKLISITPNTLSFGHRVYKQNYLHLDPPRHLNLFNNQSANKLLTLACFNTFKITTTIRDVSGTLIASSVIKNRGLYCMGEPADLSSRLWGFAMQFIEYFYIKFNRNIGEDLVIKATK
jgi:2-polyprenyl-3-methyl-5-hydroxy-6-metoxy-1,4-benzoquinol methylase